MNTTHATVARLAEWAARLSAEAGTDYLLRGDDAIVCRHTGYVEPGIIEQARAAIAAAPSRARRQLRTAWRGRAGFALPR